MSKIPKKPLRIVATGKTQPDGKTRIPPLHIQPDNPKDDKKRLLCLEKQRKALAAFGTVLSQLKEPKEFDKGEYYNDPIRPHPILSHFPIFDGADPNLSTLLHINPESLDKFLQYRKELLLKLQNAKRKESTFNPRPLF